MIEPHENAILQHAVRTPGSYQKLAHPMWFVVISLRCLGISVAELCDLAGKTEQDTLLFGQCAIEQATALRIGERYRAAARISAAGSRTTRGGVRLDNLVVRTEIVAEDRNFAGSVTSTYLFKRGNL
ncbi:hypothetical protein [Nocardia africana]